MMKKAVHFLASFSSLQSVFVVFPFHKMNFFSDQERPAKGKISSPANGKTDGVNLGLSNIFSFNYQMLVTSDYCE